MDTPDEATRELHAPRSHSAILIVALIGVLIALLLAGIAQLTRTRIARNEQAWIEQPLRELLSSVRYDNDVLLDRIAVSAPELLGTQGPRTVYRARLQGAPAALVLHAVAPDGYRGPIDLLIAIASDGSLIGVRVIRHNETPGLGDAFETRDADWLRDFRGLSLRQPPQSQWTVRRDGGAFDAFTGATITPRAIVRAVRRALELYHSRSNALFSAPAEALPE